MTKAAVAAEIYGEESAKGADGLRKRCIARFKAELGMGDAGAATYFQNTKKKAEGGSALTLKPKAPQPPTPPTVSSGFPVITDKPQWYRFDTDHNGIVLVVDCFPTEELATAALLKHGGAVSAPDQPIKIGECYK